MECLCAVDNIAGRIDVSFPCPSLTEDSVNSTLQAGILDQLRFLLPPQQLSMALPPALPMRLLHLHPLLRLPLP